GRGRFSAGLEERRLGERRKLPNALERVASLLRGERLSRYGLGPWRSENGGASFERRTLSISRGERDHREHDVRVGQDVLDPLELRRNRLPGAFSQALPQEGEQHELAQRHAPVGLHQRLEI